MNPVAGLQEIERNRICTYVKLASDVFIPGRSAVNRAEGQQNHKRHASSPPLCDFQVPLSRHPNWDPSQQADQSTPQAHPYDWMNNPGCFGGYQFIFNPTDRHAQPKRSPQYETEPKAEQHQLDCTLQNDFALFWHSAKIFPPDSAVNNHKLDVSQQKRRTVTSPPF
jgi:hypothetical protein